MKTKRENYLDNTTRCLSLVFLLEQPRKYQDGTTLAQKPQRGPTTWKDMLENAWNGIANWQTKRRSNHTRFPVLVWTITKLKGKNWRTLVNCQKFAPIYLWSVNKLARSVTKWTQACDRRLARSYIHYTSDYRQYCHVGNAAQHCRLGLLQDSNFAGDLEDSKSTSSGVLCILGSQTFVPISSID